MNWNPQLLHVRTATAEVAPEEAAKPETKPEAKADPKTDAKPEGKAEEALPVLRGIEIPEGNDKPILVYFHWPHEDGTRGRQVLKFCGGPLDDEAFVRVTSLFRCIEVNTRDSEAKLVDEAKVRTTPSLLLCRPDGAILWRTEDTSLTGKALAETLKRLLREKMAERWDAIEKEIASQRKDIVEARRLLAAGKTEDAMPLVNRVVGSDVRFTDAWAEGVRTLREEEKKAAEAEKKAKK